MSCEPERFGHPESYLHRPLVARAAAKTNRILSGTDLSAWPSWTERPAAGRPVPIYIVDDGALPRSDVAFAPNGATCLFISRRLVSRFVELFGQDGSGTFDVAAEDALALVLLHELGHFHNGDAGMPTRPARLDATQLPVMLSDPMQTELRADRFAGEQLAAASRAAERLSAAMDLTFALGHIVWNRSKMRLIDEFAATALGSPEVLGDVGYSHPNLELRFLIIWYVSSPARLKDQALALIDAFLDGRAGVPRNDDAAMF